ncbi:MAG: DUF3293 domain-containing protein [Nevskia sp.]|nr:DUF3293 domain-containing protein [Nevskia sp.]
MDPEVRAALEAAYRAAEYRVQLSGEVLVLRVDRHDRAADQRLRLEAGVHSDWAVITPCNPGSRRLSNAANAAQLRELGAMLGERCVRRIASINHDPSGRWPDEPGFLLCDPPAGFAEQLGRRYGQNAILCARLGEAPRLVWLDD